MTDDEFGEAVRAIKDALGWLPPVSVEGRTEVDGKGLVILVGDRDLAINCEADPSLGVRLGRVADLAEAAQKVVPEMIERLEEAEGILRDMAEDGKAVEEMRRLREEAVCLKEENLMLRQTLAAKDRLPGQSPLRNDFYA